MVRTPTEPPDRHPTRDACTRFDVYFGFPPDRYRQDWEIELSDGQRLDEFVAAYSNLDLNDDERFTLMALIIASADDALDFHELTRTQWAAIEDLIVASAELHASTIFCWCCVEARRNDECFSLTQRMRKVWNKAYPNSTPMPVTVN